MGARYRQDDTSATYKYRVTHCTSGHTHTVHIHGSELTIGNVYYIQFENTNHNGCYTVTQVHSGEGLHIDSVSVYADCTACIAAN